MCFIERFRRIHPNGHVELIERVRHCQFGTPTTPCNNARFVDLMDENIQLPPEVPLPPHHQVIEPRPMNRNRSPERKKKNKKVSDGLKLVFDFHVPFTARDKKKTKKKKTDRYEDAERRPRTPIALPPHLRHPPPHLGIPPPGVPQNPGVIPVPPPPPGGRPLTPHPPGLNEQPRLGLPPMGVPPYSSDESSPSPISPIRVHQRQRARSLSLTRRYEEQKQIIREREARQHAERVAVAQHEARKRAERDADYARRERDEAHARNEALRLREQRRIDHEMRRRIEAEEREMRRRSQEQRERDAERERRREEMRRWAEHERRLRRREEREREAEREQRREELRLREEIEMLQRAQEERERRARQVRARIPLLPRHPAEIHHPARDSFERRARESFEQHGNDVIDNAIRAEQLRQAERPAPYRRDQWWPDDGGLRRRGTVAIGERIVYDDDRRRWGRRWA